MSACALIVDFRLHPGAWPAFYAILSEHARMTLAEEGGCKQFDVLHDDADPDHAILVEVYSDRAAYEEHRSNPRMASVTEQLAPLTIQRTRSICTVTAASAP